MDLKERKGTGLLNTSEMIISANKYYVLYLKLHVVGLHDREIAKELGISKTYLNALKRNLKKYLKVDSDFNLIKKAFLYKLLDWKEFINNDFVEREFINTMREIYFNRNFFEINDNEKTAIIYAEMKKFCSKLEYEILMNKIDIYDVSDNLNGSK